MEFLDILISSISRGGEDIHQMYEMLSNSVILRQEVKDNILNVQLSEHLGNKDDPSTLCFGQHKA